jgi:hypothetical protein
MVNMGVASPVSDALLAAASFADGRAGVADGLPPAPRQRLAAVRMAVDPDRRLAPSRIPADDAAV